MRIAMLLLLAVAGCKKAPPEPAAPKVGWVQEAGWPAACYFPKPWETLSTSDRKLQRQEALEEMMKQWTGGHDEVVKFDENVATDVETALLGRPEKTESIADENAQQCATAMAGGGNTSAWSSWLGGLPRRLNAGECDTPLVDTWFNYIDLALGWQSKAPVCAGNVVSVKASGIDYFQLYPKGPWINAAGDSAESTAGKTEFPCNVEGCYRGMLVLRFTSSQGVVNVYPIGLQGTFEAPEIGYIQVMINDDNLADNRYKVESGMEHHTSIEYSPG